MPNNPILSGADVRLIREKLGLSQSELARILGVAGARHTQTNWMSQIEREVNGRHLDHAKANLLIAIKSGYKPKFAKEST